jgi:putative ABC transport system permease protein
VAASRLVRAFLFGVSPLDPLVMAEASFVVLLLALAASLVPAWRAVSLDFTKALRSE